MDLLAHGRPILLKVPFVAWLSCPGLKALTRRLSPSKAHGTQREACLTAGHEPPLQAISGTLPPLCFPPILLAPAKITQGG